MGIISPIYPDHVKVNILSLLEIVLLYLSAHLLMHKLAVEYHILIPSTAGWHANSEPLSWPSGDILSDNSEVLTLNQPPSGGSSILNASISQ